MARQAYQEQLLKLNGELIEMGDLCEEAMSLVMKALREKDEEIAVSVHKIEQKIDQKERDIEAMCMTLLLRQQPVSGDLRSISSALRMIADMERIGDQTADIADVSRHLTDFQLEVHPKIFHMGKIASKMVNDSVNAFVRKDDKLAAEVIATDDQVDRLFEEIKMELMEEIAKNPNSSGSELDVLMIAKYMERIGDHAADISEMTVWIHGENYVTHLNLLEEMAKAVTVMLVGSIDAFVCKNLKQAEEVIAKDDIVDDLFLKVKEEVIQMLRESDGSGEEAADLLLIAKYFERIGDHATNISEWVIYSITGKHVS